MDTYDVLVPVPEGAILRHVPYSNPPETAVLALPGDSSRMLRIGILSREDGYMYPNDSYFQMYAEDYEKFLASGDPHVRRDRKLSAPLDISPGMYAALLGTAERLHLDTLLAECFQTDPAADLLDCACCILLETVYSRHRSARQTADRVPPPEKDILLGCSALQENWIRRQVQSGTTGAYVCIDSLPGEKDGHAPYLWLTAADGEHRGLPLAAVTWEGGFPSASDFRNLEAQLQEYGLKTAGVILGSECSSDDHVETLVRSGLPYTVSLDICSPVFREMLEKHGKEIRNEPRFQIGNLLFATSDQVTLAGRTACATLFYSPMEEIENGNSIAEDVRATADMLRNSIARGGDTEMPHQFREFIRIEGTTVRIDEDRVKAASRALGYTAVLSSRKTDTKETSRILSQPNQASSVFRCAADCREDRPRFQVRLTAGLLAGILFTELRDLTASAADFPETDVWDMSSGLDEVGYRMMGNTCVFRSRDWEPVKLLQALGIYPGRLRELSSREGIQENGSRKTVSSCGAGRSGRMPSWDFTLEGAVQAAAPLEQDIGSGSSAGEESPDEGLDTGEMVRADAAEKPGTEIPEQSGSSSESGTPPEQDTGGSDAPESPDGGQETADAFRAGGTAEAAGEEAEQSSPPPARRKRGRPKGSKDSAPRKKRKHKDPENPGEAAEETPKRKPGRPKGSKDSVPRKRRTQEKPETPGGAGKETETAAEKAGTEAAGEETPKRKRGRPKGSKNSVPGEKRTQEEPGSAGKEAETAAEKAGTAETGGETPKRGRGRPKGSKDSYKRTRRPKDVSGQHNPGDSPPPSEE